MRELIAYLTQRPEGLGFVLLSGIDRTLVELFDKPDQLLPKPYRIFFHDEAETPAVGFPVRNSPAVAELHARLDRWVSEELACQADRSAPREKAHQALTAYSSTLSRLAENAMLSNMLADYHGIFWLAHSQELAKQFSTIPRRLGALDTQLARTSGDAIKYRVYARWSSEVREAMTRLCTRLAPTLEGEQDRAMAFVRLLLDNVLILTEEFVGPDLREIRSFISGYLQRDVNPIKDSVERLRKLSAQLVSSDPAFRGAVSLFGVEGTGGIPIALVLDRRFQEYVLRHPSAEGLLSRDERDQLAILSRRLSEFSILYQLRRGIVWMTSHADGMITSSDRRGTVYSRATRPIDFGRPGVVDPMVWRFGLMYDLAAFAETLGELARGGAKEEMASYRQMVQFQRRMESIAERHRLQFEKFLGDGAFYTTRRAIRLIRAGIEIQRLYAEMRAGGFPFNRGIRIAMNYGYYRLLPMKGSGLQTDRSMEFYGPGIVELSRLTTGKATKEIEELQSFLVVHGYEPDHVQKFFAPLAQGVDTVDHAMHAREFYAYVNANGHLVNEGIVASSSLLSELSNELQQDQVPLTRVQTVWGNCVAFPSGLPATPLIAARILGTVSLKGLGKIEIGEILPLMDAQSSADPIDPAVSLLTAIRTDHMESATADRPASDHAVELDPFPEFD